MQSLKYISECLLHLFCLSSVHSFFVVISSMNWHLVAVVKMTSLLVLLTAKLESIKETNHEEDKALDLGLEGEAASVTVRFLRMCVCVNVAHARYVWLQVNVKGDPKQTQQLAWKHPNCANISVCRLCTVILSVLMQQGYFLLSFSAPWYAAVSVSSLPVKRWLMT